MTNLKLEFKKLTPSIWGDFEQLFGARGACGGCWCMWWRLPKKEFDALKGEGNRMKMKTLVDSNRIPGILAYYHKEPIGWCSVAPREEYPRLENSRILKRVDDNSVWSVVCFFIQKKFRGQGVSVQLLKAAIDYVREKGGAIVEGYAIEPKQDHMPDVFAYNGPVKVFHKAGFKEVARRSETRPIMRYKIKKSVK